MAAKFYGLVVLSALLLVEKLFFSKGKLVKLIATSDSMIEHT